MKFDAMCTELKQKRHLCFESALDYAHSGTRSNFLVRHSPSEIILFYF